MGRVIHKRDLAFGTECGIASRCGEYKKWRKYWGPVTCKRCKRCLRCKPKPKVHKWWYLNKVRCGLKVQGIRKPVLYRMRWPDVTCGNCLRHRPVRRKK
jgi:hypothetical protein